MSDDTVYDGTSLPLSSAEPEPEGEVTVTAGSLDERVAWVAAGESQDERSVRADAVYAHEDAAGDTDLEALGPALVGAVYQQTEPGSGDATAGTGIPPEGGDGPSYEDVAPDEPVTGEPETVVAPTGEDIPGKLVESDTAGTGDAVNIDTGEVTPGGQPLPEYPADEDVTTIPPIEGEPPSTV